MPSDEQTTVISLQTKISIAFVLVLVTAASTFGIMHQKVENQGEKINEMQETMQKMNEDTVEIKSELKTISYQLQGIQELKVLLRDKYARYLGALDK